MNESSPAMGWFYLVSAALLLVVSLGCAVRMTVLFRLAFTLSCASPAIALGGYLAWSGWRRIDPGNAARVSAVITPRLAAWLVLLISTLLIGYELLLTDYGRVFVDLAWPGLLTGAVLVVLAGRRLWRPR